MTAELRRFDITVERPKSAGDQATVPVSATVTLSRQGATADVGDTVEATPTNLSVADVGDIVVGDVLQLNTDTTKTMTVTTVANQGALTAQRTGSWDGVIAAGDRFVVTSGLPTLYQDAVPISTRTVTNPMTTSSSTGSAGAFVALRKFDVLVTVGTDVRLYIDQEGGVVRAARRDVEYGVMASGSDTDAAANSAALAALFGRVTFTNEVSRRIVLPYGERRIATPVVLDGARPLDSVVVEMDPGATIAASDSFSGSNLFYLSPSLSHRIGVLRGGTLDGRNIGTLTALALDPGLEELWIENMRFVNLDGGVVLGTSGDPAKRVHMTHCHFESIDTTCVAIYSADGFDAEGCVFEDVGRCFRVIPASAGDTCRNVRIAECTARLRTSGVSDFLVAQGQDVDNHQDLIVESNRVYDAQSACITVSQFGAWNSSDNRLYRCKAAGITSLSTKGAEISGGVIKGVNASGAGVGGVLVTAASDPTYTVRVVNVQVEGFADYGIRFEAVVSGSIIGASVRDCYRKDASPAGAGIEIDGSCDRVRVGLGSSTANGDTYGYGIIIESGATDTIVVANDFSGNISGDKSDLGTDTIYQHNVVA